MRSLPRPDDLFDRSHEWQDLAVFATQQRQPLQIGVLSGRRRQGKSFLLRRLCRSVRGLYSVALEEQREPALARFGADYARGLGLGASVRFSDWGEALGNVLAGPTSVPLLVLDEFPYLLRHSQELPSLLQHLFDSAAESAAGRPANVILCGSALSVMTELLSGTKALRGRATLDLRLRPFDFRSAAAFWDARDAEVALHLHAIFGGTPGYRDLVAATGPSSIDDLGEWLASNVLSPSHALFREDEYLLQEDPRITDRSLYHSILDAVAAGESTPTRIGGRVGRDARSLAHPLAVLEAAGFVTRDDDLLLQRRPTLTLADPIVRFIALVVKPRQATFEERDAASGWASAASTFAAQVLGPHFESLARDWTRRFSSARTWGEPVGEVGTATISDPAGRAQHQVDVVALAQGQRRQPKRPRVVVLGEAKAAEKKRTMAEVARLQKIRELLVARGIDASGARLAVFARNGFDKEVAAAARKRHDLVLVDLERMYTSD